MIHDIQERRLTYCLKQSSQVPHYLMQLERSTHLQTLNPAFMSDHLQGRVLSMISRMIKPRQVIEIGTFTGYSALCLAEGLHPDGLLMTVEKNLELRHLAEKAIQSSPYNEQIVIRNGDALDIIPKLESKFDLAYIDGAKVQYQQYFEMLIPKMSAAGMILVDNTLWKDKIFASELPLDRETEAIISFNEFLQRKDYYKVMIPLTDGLTLIHMAN